MSTAEASTKQTIVTHTEDGSAIYTEGLAKTFAPTASRGEAEGPKDVFINPIQCYNRDLSVLAIRTWSEMVNAEKQAARLAKRAKNDDKKRKKENSKKRTIDQVEAEDEGQPDAPLHKAEGAAPQDKPEVAHQEQAKTTKDHPPFFFTAFEALAASALRSIRYALELPLLKSVLANDLSAQAVENMRRNLTLNGYPQDPAAVTPTSKASNPIEKVFVNEGDCLSVMYQHRENKSFDVIDLDPYGTAAPFIDAAVQSVSDGGLLCVTCTDLAVLAGTNYPEKCFSNYGGVTARAEYCHEGALRLVLQTLSNSAARYGRRITPLLSLSIDYYLRVFVRVSHSAIETKKAITTNGIVYVCSFCQNHVEQPFGRMHEKPSKNKNNNNTTTTFKTAAAPQGVSSHCHECGNAFHLAGPMWLGPLHDPTFVDKMLASLNEPEGAQFNTLTRIKGMLTIAKNELEAPFYFIPSKTASCFHTSCPSLTQIINALHHLGYEVSRSHAAAGSVKTDAPRSAIHDIFMAWVDDNPVKMDKIDDKAPAKKLLTRERVHTNVSFETHPKTAEVLLNDIKLVRYQTNPEPNWGPQSRAVGGQSNKRQKQG